MAKQRWAVYGRWFLSLFVLAPIVSCSKGDDHTQQPDESTVVVEEVDTRGFLVAGRINVKEDSTGEYRMHAVLVRYNPDGSLDTTFGPSGSVGGGGKVILALQDTFAHSVALQMDGKVVVAGDVGGDPDLAFINRAKAVTMQSDHKIVVAGHFSNAFPYGQNVAVARYR